MKKILFLCESYYRLPSPNGICVQKVAEKLVETGNHVDVITLFSSENQLQFENVNGVNVHRVDPGYIRRKLYTNDPQSHPESEKKYKAILKLSALNGMLKAFRYPLLSTKQVDNLYVKAQELHEQKQYQHVVVVYQQIHPVLAGIKLKKKTPNINLILYTLDAISGGWVPSIMHSHKIPMNSLKRWERYFFDKVDRVFAMESHRGQYEKKEYEKYQEKIDYLDIPLVIPEIPEMQLQKNSNLVHFVYTGSMHKDTANPQYLLKLLPFLDEVRVDLYGSISPDILEMLKKTPEYGKKIFVHGKISHDEIVKIQKNADVLLNFGNANPNMIPCKIFEYISTGGKIISFTHSTEDSSLPYMKKYPLALVIEEVEGMEQNNAEKIITFMDRNMDALDSKRIETDFYLNTPDCFEERLQKNNEI